MGQKTLSFSTELGQHVTQKKTVSCYRAWDLLKQNLVIDSALVPLKS